MQITQSPRRSRRAALPRPPYSFDIGAYTVDVDSNGKASVVHRCGGSPVRFGHVRDAGRFAQRMSTALTTA